MAQEALAARRHLSKDPRVQAARGLVKQRRYIEAFKILRPIARASGERADRTDVLFLYGLSAIEAARSLPPARRKERLALFDEAIAAAQEHPHREARSGARQARTRAGVLL